MKVKAQSQKYLKKFVLDEGLCTGCGACVGLCPYQVIYHDRTVQLHPCDLTDGRCFDYCPRTPADLQAIREVFFAKEDLTPEIGAVKGYFFSRATDADLRAVSQHGGTVTALLGLALAEGWIDSAIVASPQQDLNREGVMVRDGSDLRKNAKSQFTVSPTVAAFHRLATENAGAVGVVATPCQALALAKMRFHPGREDAAKADRLKLVVGLYCGWTLEAEKYARLLREKEIDWASVLKTDIPAGKNVLEVFTGGGRKTIPFEEVQDCIREACRYCVDSTAEFADVSVGSARFAGDWEEVRQWNQLIVRSERGRQLVELAAHKGVLEIREAPAESLQELKEAAARKKTEALKNLVRKSGSVKNLLYLDGRDPAVKKYLEVENKIKKRSK